MSETFKIDYTPNLGADERPYMLIFYFGGLDGSFSPITQKLLDETSMVEKNGKKFYSFTAKVVYPGSVVPSVLPADFSLVCIAIVRRDSDDDRTMKYLGAEEGGSVIIQLRGVTKIEKALVFHNAARMYPDVDFTKGVLSVEVITPLNKKKFAVQNKFTISPGKELDDKTPLIAAIIGQSRYGQKTHCIYPLIEGIPCMPPWEFDTLVLPGSMLSYNRNPEPHSCKWWENLLAMGVSRVFPRISASQGLNYVHDQIRDTRTLAAVAVSAAAIPANYWFYASDETEVGETVYQCENYTVLSRAKLGVVSTVNKHGNPRKQYVVPCDDCENDGDDIRILIRELQTMKLEPSAHPALSKIQSALKNYVVVQSLTGVHGAKQPDGDTGEYKESIGLHSMTDLIHKQYLVTAHGKINSARPLFEGWLANVDPAKEIIASKHAPLCGEGTGTVDPLGDDDRNRYLDDLKRFLSSTRKASCLEDLKLISPTTLKYKDLDRFYVSKVSFVVPELLEKSYDRCMFTPVTISNGKIQRMVKHEDFMECSPSVGLRVEPAITEEQAQLIKHVHSFYPSVPNFKEPEPFETSEVRQRYSSKMNRIAAAFCETKRKPKDPENAAIVDFYAPYFKITSRRVKDICDLVKTSTMIVGVKVEEEAVAAYLGGYRLAFMIE